MNTDHRRSTANRETIGALLATKDFASASLVVPDSRVGEFEEEIQAAFADCFRISDVAPDDDFFAMGGNSLRAAMVLERIFRRFHIRLQPDVFFTCPTPRLLAGAVAAHRVEAPALDGGSLVPLSAADRASRCSSFTASRRGPGCSARWFPRFNCVGRLSAPGRPI